LPLPLPYLRGPGARTANGTALCYEVQLYRYFVSQSSEFCRHNPLCCFSTCGYCSCYFVIDSVRKLLDIPSYSSFPLLRTHAFMSEFWTIHLVEINPVEISFEKSSIYTDILSVLKHGDAILVSKSSTHVHNEKVKGTRNYFERDTIFS
jgi:hypothetical protein